MLIRWRLLTIALLAVLIAVAWCVLGPVRPATAAPVGGFTPPLPPPLTVIGAFTPPAQPWLPGNRGVDLAANTGEPVFAAADGVVLYAGLLAGRGVVSISHGDLRTTYEPVDVAVHVGDHVRQGQLVGHVSAAADGCGPPGGCLHWGALRGDTYVDPMSLLKAARIRLLPIWTADLPRPPFSAALDTPATGTQAATRPARATSPGGAASPRSRPDREAAASALSIASALSMGAGLGIGAAAGATARWRARRSRSPAGAGASSAQKPPAL